MKRCKRKQCRRLLPPASFNRSSSTDDGLQSYCRTCQSMANAQRRTKNPASQQEKYRRNKFTNPERWSALRRLRYQVKGGFIIKTPCHHEYCDNPVVKAYLEPPDYDITKALWFCQLHHPNKRGNPHDEL